MVEKVHTLSLQYLNLDSHGKNMKKQHLESLKVIEFEGKMVRTVWLGFCYGFERNHGRTSNCFAYTCGMLIKAIVQSEVCRGSIHPSSMIR